MCIIAPKEIVRFDNISTITNIVTSITGEWADSLELYIDTNNQISFFDVYSTYKMYKFMLKRRFVTSDEESLKILKDSFTIILRSWRRKDVLFNVINEVCVKYDPISNDTNSEIYGMFSKFATSVLSHKIDVTFLLFEVNIKVEYSEDSSKWSSYLYKSIIKTFIDTMGHKDQYTKRHCERVYEVAKKFGRYISLPEDKMEELTIASILHDVGKIGISESILTKKGKLTEAEYNIMKKHTDYGEQVIRKIPGFDKISDVVKYHHERYDGNGYYNLPRDRISQNMYIIGLCDAFDSMNANRPYRTALGSDVIIEEYRRCSGKQFEPNLCDQFMNFLSSNSKDITNIYSVAN